MTKDLAIAAAYSLRLFLLLAGHLVFAQAQSPYRSIRFFCNNDSDKEDTLRVTYRSPFPILFVGG